MASIREFKQTNFSNEMLGDIPFEGFTDGETWNGWACPYFTYDIAEGILKASESNGYRWNFDTKADAFFVRHIEDSEDSSPDQFKGIQVVAADQAVVLYAVGAYSWSWEISRK